MARIDPTTRTRVRRVPQRADYDRTTVEAILDEAIVCHLAFVHEGQPFCIPTLHARVGETIYLHGSAASRMLRTLEQGVPACLTVTHVDGLVLARSAFHHSVNYRSAVVVGTLTLVADPEEKERALEAFTEQLVPGRWADIRWPNRKELKGTKVLAMHLAEASAKVRTGGPVDDDEDYALDAWAGVVPLTLTAGDPIADDRLRPGIERPAYVDAWEASSRGSSSDATAASTASGANGASSAAARAA